MESRVTKRSIVIAGRKTSITLEDEFWKALKHIASVRNLKLTALIGSIDSGRTGNLSSAIRLFLLKHYPAMINTPAASPSAHADTRQMR